MDGSTSLNLIVTCIGLLICFGGIYWKRFISGLTGFVWGVLIGFIIAFVQVEFYRQHMEDSTEILLIFSCAILLCVLSVWLERLFAALNSFILSFFIICILGFASIEHLDSISAVLTVAGLLALLVACAAYALHNYAYIISTAFSGALIAVIGGTAFTLQSDISEVLMELVLDGEEYNQLIAFLTLILGCLGCCVQFYRFHSTGAKTGPAIPSINTGRAASAVTSAASSAKAAVQKAAEAAAPVLQHKDENIQGMFARLKAEQSRKSLLQELRESDLLFIPVWVYVWIVPLLYRLLNGIPYSSAFYSAVYYVRIVSGAMSLGMFVFFVLTRSPKSNLVYASFAAVGNLLFNFHQLSYHPLVILGFFEYFLIWAVLAIVMKLIQKDAVKPLLAAVLAWFISYYPLDWIVYLYVVFRINLWNMMLLAIVVAENYLLFRKQYHINIFKPKAAPAAKRAAPSPAPIQVHIGNSPQRYCAKCNRFYPRDDAFCAICGEKLPLVCPKCFHRLAEGDAFCGNCGTPL